MPRPSNIAEGRAVKARPSLRLLPVLFLAMMVMPSSVEAAPPTPHLNGTTPKSPSTSLTPLVYGSSEGKVISSIPGLSSYALRTTSDLSPTNVIKLYTDAACEGPPAAQGTAGQLDGAGIQVTVAADTTTTFYAKQFDESGPSGCSGPLVYQHMTKLPEPPVEEPPSGGPPPGPTSSPPGPGVGEAKALPVAPHLRIVPGGSANDNTPLVTGSAPGAATVRIFTNPDCAGAPVAKGPVAEFDSGFEVQVVNNVTVAFYGVSVAPGGGQSVCSAPVYYVEDSTPPHTRITLGPAAKTTHRSPVFRFTDIAGDSPGTTFLCKVDHRKWKVCRTPLHLHHLSLSSHLLRIKAIDPAGNRETRGARRRFKVIPHP